MKINRILIAFVFLSLLSCGEDKDTYSPKEWVTFSENNYSIEHPKNWELQNNQKGAEFIILSGRSSNGDMFQENVNLLVQDLGTEKVNLDEFIELSEGQIKAMLKNFKFYKNERKKANGLNFHLLEYEGKQGVFDLHFMQYCWIEQDKVYVLTFTAEQKQFKKFENTANRIMKSFKMN